MIFSSKLSTFFILVLILLSSNLFAGNISGVLVSGTHDTLKVVDSPFTATGNISVLAGDTLTIEPGVVINFNGGVNFTLDGTLIATGTSSDSIRFTSSNASPNLGDWNGILFSSTGGGTLKYLVVEYASTGISVSNSDLSIRNSSFRSNNNGIDCLNASSPLIDSNQFQSNGNTAIRCNDASPTISKNKIFNNVALSAAILCEKSHPQISENVIHDNDHTAIDCIIGSKPDIWQNTIVQNDFGITISDSSSPAIENNIVVSNMTLGIAVNDPEAVPTIKYNNVWSNTAANFFGTPAGVGDLNTTNSNGDPSDVFFNISMNPVFANTGSNDFTLQASSPGIDAGNPANPAGIFVLGSAPEMGAFEYGAAVPVELASFGFYQGVLRWSTASETNNFGFEVQRSNSKNEGFVKVAFVRGHGTTTVPQLYEFKDDVFEGVYFYRLKQIDTDGSFELSQTVEAVYSNPSTFTLDQNYPNPFNPTTTLSFAIPETGLTEANEPVRLTIFNSMGQEVLVLLNERKGAGSYNFQWNGVDKLGRAAASGVYFYELRFGQMKQTRRMLLIK